ncbi:ATP-binding cassette domain-containing protein, partial [Pseudomonas syringae]
MTSILPVSPLSATLLSVEQVEVFYEQSILALRGVSLQVRQGQIVALLGANGAGKSTTLKAISSLVRAERGEMVSG